MRVPQLGALAVVVGGVQSFLIPPEISTADADAINTLPAEAVVAGLTSRVIEIQCPGCPVVTELKGKPDSAQPDSVLHFNFSTSHENGVDQVLVNGLQIYPIDPTMANFLEPLTASQMIKSNGVWTEAGTPKLGFSLSVKHPPSSGPEFMQTVAIRLEIVEVADKFISGLPAIELNLLETPSGQLMIGNSSISAPSSPARLTGDDKECSTIACKWRAIVADRLSKMKQGLRKGCAGMRKRPTTKGRPSGHSHPDHKARPDHRPHAPSRHHHQHSFAKFLRGIFLHVFVPVIIGVMVGITAGLIGMVVGHIVIFTWRSLFRSGQKNSAYAEVGQEDTKDETKGFLAFQGPPPQYADAAVPEKE
ncbi:uncharacterized protein L3040_008191 [Drepanopeziza brunnea f. sp. 'multigermtubi']|uniref:DUF7728 domain-containing protein n=1 Tax=Marssonina brunnea f. sp. multigermtubi (strain MB_m1) TaxID=1072389 RepID=K1XJ22_MARBU|nr:uncharacterized protein MBM_09350 [Drepanopeziza brunnea f. sp. 'multigermtubi' MB_m1]EKD12484.1 hypothetical protein MBM_09350 [Drepanopeziza brunnea f. sp. 'multigermtubi' MB_m1]KAJ5034923.1 hypothetical protein L3040_008191 [Drepanopeziza brunnea f. sp. 'multigermtubi']